MTNSTNTKKSLLISILSMIVCLAMLIGSTFAWFSDSVVSGKNQIIAGNLDVEMEYATLNDDGSATWNPVTEKTSLFDGNALWEPGYTQVVYLRVKNLGSLSLNYKLSVNIYNEQTGINKGENTFRLSKILKFGAISFDNERFFENRTAARNAIGEAGNIRDYTMTGDIEANANEQYITLVVYMPEEVGNEANHHSTINNSVPSIDLGITLDATQMMDENDSFGNDYDKNAFQDNSENGAFADLNQNTFSVSTEAELLKLADLVVENDFEGKTITLADDITLTQANWTPIGTERNPFRGTFDGGNHTIYGLNITEYTNTLVLDNQKGVLMGLFGKVENATIKNLTVDGNITFSTEATTNENIGGIIAGGICAYVKNVTIQNCRNNVAMDLSGVHSDEEGNPSVLMGGIVGAIDVGASFMDCTNLANLTGYKGSQESGPGSQVFVGGITSLYYLVSVNFTDCENLGELTGTFTKNREFDLRDLYK